MQRIVPLQVVEVALVAAALPLNTYFQRSAIISNCPEFVLVQLPDLIR